LPETHKVATAIMRAMFNRAFIRRFAAWIACLAMLFAALAPSVSHAMAAAQGDAWTEICSASGIKMVKADMAGDTEQASPHLEHCAFCATHPDALAVLSSKAWSIPVLAGREDFPPLFYQSSSPLANWSPAQSRAPPA
jgi:hypothetical protein